MTADETPGAAARAPVEHTLATCLRDDWGRLLGGLVRRTGRLDVAEDALAEAFAAATKQWPTTGIPEQPGAWLARVAANRAADLLRHEAMAARKIPLVGGLMGERAGAAGKHPGDDVDDRLALLFMAAHPALAPKVRPALALRFVLGVATDEIARLFLVPVPTMQARLTRAKKQLVASGVPFEVPDVGQWPERVTEVAQAIYLAFTAGYLPGPDGSNRVRMAGDAVWLALLADDLLPGQPVLEALAALLVAQHSRRDARLVGGRLVGLADQDRSRWRANEVVDALGRVLRLRPATGWAEELRLQAVIAACHARTIDGSSTDWATIVAAYERLHDLTGSPVVALNRAAAIGAASGPMAGLAALQAAADALPGHHRVAVVRAELLRDAGDVPAAQAAYELALSLCPAGPEADHLVQRLATLHR